MRKNDIIQLAITAINHEGNGVGRHEGMAVFVPYTAIGDQVVAKVAKLQKSYAFAILKEILTPSADRADNDCPVFGRCGGCALRHMTYEAELAVKADWVRENLRRIGGVEVDLSPILPSPERGRYRNKAQYPVRLVDGKIQAGFFAKRSHRLVPVEDCLLQPESFRLLVKAITGFMEERGIAPYDEERHTGLVRHIFLREGEATGQLMAWLVINGESLPHWQELVERLKAVHPGLASFGVDRNRRRTNVIFGGDSVTLYGQDTITDKLAGVTLELSPLTFYQVNRRAAEALFETALAYADPRPEDVLLDLYCGAGAVGLTMAHAVGQLVGVEVVAPAVENARRNAERNGIANARFLCADATEAVAQLRQEGLRPDIIVLDPPRAGADSGVIEAIAALAPRKVVYISCNSATLARDVKLLGQRGYRPSKATPADLFPRTANVECCCLLEPQA